MNVWPGDLLILKKLKSSLLFFYTLFSGEQKSKTIHMLLKSSLQSSGLRSTSSNNAVWVKIRLFSKGDYFNEGYFPGEMLEFQVPEFSSASWGMILIDRGKDTTESRLILKVEKVFIIASKGGERDVDIRHVPTWKWSRRDHLLKILCSRIFSKIKRKNRWTNTNKHLLNIHCINYGE